MPKSCLEGYLTPACAACQDWVDGSDERGIGCATHYQIMHCEHFAKMTQEEDKKQRICKNCAHYDKREKMCSARGDYTARKNKCAAFSWL